MTTSAVKSTVLWLFVFVLWQMVITSSCKSFSEADVGREDMSLFELFSEVVSAFFSSFNVFMTRIQQAISGTTGVR
ncbi:unnamed protein product [Ixodes pacificus]